VLLEERRYGEAEASFRRAVEREPQMAEAWNGLGVAAASAGRDEEAIAAWRRAIDLDATKLDALLNLALLYRRLGRRSDEGEALERFLRHAPPSFVRERREAEERLSVLGRSIS
jgi:Flp pilus assembly protein TadD